MSKVSSLTFIEIAPVAAEFRFIVMEWSSSFLFQDHWSHFDNNGDYLNTLSITLSSNICNVYKDKCAPPSIINDYTCYISMGKSTYTRVKCFLALVRALIRYSRFYWAELGLPVCRMTTITLSASLPWNLWVVVVFSLSFIESTVAIYWHYSLNQSMTSLVAPIHISGWYIFIAACNFALSEQPMFICMIVVL